MAQLDAEIPWESLANLLLSSLPLPPIDAHDRRSTSIDINEKSFTHQLDLACRKVVAEVLASSPDSKRFASHLSKFKQHFLRHHPSQSHLYPTTLELESLVDQATHTFKGELLDFLNRLQRSNVP